jgi:arsenate reductase (glutaredoxin)
MIILYGIPNCDTVKKARAWLADHGKDHEFHDFKKHGVPAAELARWADAVGWESLLNRKGTTWRKLAPADQAAVQGSASAQGLMQAQTSVIKRPVVDWGGGDLTVGFDPKVWEKRA